MYFLKECVGNLRLSWFLSTTLRINPENFCYLLNQSDTTSAETNCEWVTLVYSRFEWFEFSMVFVTDSVPMISFTSTRSSVLQQKKTFL